MKKTEFAELEKELEHFSTKVAEQFRASTELLEKRLSSPEISKWAEVGINMARNCYKSWDAVSEYFKATPPVLDNLDFATLIAWADSGGKLCQIDSTLATAYFKSSPQTVSYLPAENITEWAKLGQNLYQKDWKSTALAVKFFTDSPKIVRWLSLDELKQFTQLVKSLAQKHYDMANELIDSAKGILPGIAAGERKHFITLGAAIAKIGTQDTWSYIKCCSQALSRVNSSQRGQFMNLTEQIVKLKPDDAASFFADGAEALGKVKQELHTEVLQRFEELRKKSLPAAMEFLKSSPAVLRRINSQDLDEWFEAGIRILGRNEDEGIAYFQLKSDRGEAILDQLAPGADLASFKEVLHRYCKALTGKDVEIVAEEEAPDKTISWTLAERLSPEGTIIYLPSHVKRYPTKEENFAWLKVMVTQQAGHLEFGTNEFSFDKPSHFFDDMRPRLPKPTLEEGEEEEPLTDLERFFRSFQDIKLAKAIFNVVEDARIDYILKQEYKGLSDTYEKIQREELELRRPIHLLRFREALVWLLVDLTLKQLKNIHVPEEGASHLKSAAPILGKVMSSEATVEDSAEATIRLYSIVNKAPNLIFPPEAWQMAEATAEEKKTKKTVTAAPEPSIEDLEVKGEEGPPQDYETEEIEISLKDVADGKLPLGLLYTVYYEPDEMEATDAEGWEAPPTEEAEQIYYYDEWDYAAGSYRPKWCTVKERTLEEGADDVVQRTNQENPQLVEQIRSQFQVLELGLLKKIKKLPDGEGLDLDDALQAIVDKKAGTTPDERIYWRKQKVERDVCVALLLDMSASTAEPIEKNELKLGTPLIPTMMPKRIIDIAKESISLLIGALETIGDKYGIYGFSSYGREHINFSIVKEIDEPFSPKVGKRIDQISPLHATRMGPAIRHATAKLEAKDAKNRILFLISDGRPRDLEYGKGHADKEYAIHDTKMAFTEAARKGIAPFCLTVDKEGHDYMRDMMSSDMGYEVLDDIKLLPERLPQLYRRLSI